MRTRFLFPLIPLLVFGAILFGGSTTIAEVGFFAVKAVFFIVAFGFVVGMMKGRHPGGRPGWGRHHDRAPETDGVDKSTRPSPEDRFEDWHRLAHAKEEVDGWVDDSE